MSGTSRGGHGRTRRSPIVFLLAASMLGGAVLAFVAGRGERVELSSIPLSDAPPTDTTYFRADRRPRPHDGAPAVVGGHGGEMGVARDPALANPGNYYTVGPDDDDRVSVYVYDDVPELDFSDLVQCYRNRHGGVPPWQDEQADMAQDMGEIWLHRAFLLHPWRVLDPEEADVFFVPMYPVLSSKVELGGALPWAWQNAKRIQDNKCQGFTHTARLDAAVHYLSVSSPFFNRFGGADHVVVCAWWDCRVAMSNYQRMILRRTVIGINEQNLGWCRWGCGVERMVTLPYTASSVLTTSSMIGGGPAEERDIPFFFVGTARNRPERANLDVVKNISKDSVILLGGGNGHDWGMDSTAYAEHMARSKFCFCPRGDTETSRRIFDALAAGCIPIATETGVAALPPLGTGVNYSEFVIVVGPTNFRSREGVRNTTLAVLAMSDKEVADLRNGSTAGVSSLLYGVTEGARMSDMRPFLGTATNFLQTSYGRAGGGGAVQRGVEVNMWDCEATKMVESKLAPRTKVELPPVAWQRRQWLAESETIVNQNRSLVFCAPPNAGSLQFRMLAKRMQGLSHWSAADDWELLFDPAASELELLDVTDGPLMREIYKENGSGWIKIAVVRDPVTRLLSAYLDIVRMWRAGLRNVEEGPQGDPQEDLQQDPQEDLQEDPQEDPQSPPSPGSYGSPQEQSADHDRKRQLRQAEGDKGASRREENGRRKTRLGGTRSSEWEFLDAILEMRQLKEEHARNGRDEETTARNINVHYRHGEEEGEEESDAFSGEGFRGWDGPETRGAARGHPAEEERAQGYAHRALDAGDVLSGFDGVHIPTLAEVVDTLKVQPWKAPTAFRATVSLCGHQNSPFDSIIPFERLQKTSTEVLKSLPGEIWESFGASGWGPDGKHAFMEFDYGGAAWRKNIDVRVGDAPQEWEDGDPLPRRASDLYEGGSCAWAEYYDLKTLDSLITLYALDYSHLGWYKLGPWRERLKACYNGKAR